MIWQVDRVALNVLLWRGGYPADDLDAPVGGPGKEDRVGDLSFQQHGVGHNRLRIFLFNYSLVLAPRMRRMTAAICSPGKAASMSPTSRR